MLTKMAKKNPTGDKMFPAKHENEQKKKDDWNTLEMFFIVLGRANEMLDECKWKKVGNTR